MFQGSRMIVIPVVPAAMMRAGQMPRRTKMNPRTIPRVVRTHSSAKRMVRTTDLKRV